MSSFTWETLATSKAVAPFTPHVSLRAGVPAPGYPGSLCIRLVCIFSVYLRDWAEEQKICGLGRQNKVDLNCDPKRHLPNQAQKLPNPSELLSLPDKASVRIGATTRTTLDKGPPEYSVSGSCCYL